LKEAARRLGVAYSTVFHRRERIGFRLPGCRKWLIWPQGNRLKRTVLINIDALPRLHG